MAAAVAMMAAATKSIVNGNKLLWPRGHIFYGHNQKIIKRISAVTWGQPGIADRGSRPDHYGHAVVTIMAAGVGGEGR